MALELEQSDEKHWVCDCCGDTSHTVWGWVHEVGRGTRAAYFVSWADQGSHRPHVTLGPTCSRPSTSSWPEMSGSDR